jgi:hypothetical protein
MMRQGAEMQIQVIDMIHLWIFVRDTGLCVEQKPERYPFCKSICSIAHEKIDLRIDSSYFERQQERIYSKKDNPKPG